jgi:hypothetical protein
MRVFPTTLALLAVASTFFLKDQSTWATGYSVKQGKGYVICDAVKKQLDQFGKLNEPLVCTERLAREVPGIKEANWQDLDVEANWDLFVKLNRDDLKPGKQITEARFDELMTQWREAAKVGNVKMQVLRANIQLFDDAPETIVRLWRRHGCDDKSHQSSIHLVTEDLKDIDLPKRQRAYWLSGGDLVVYGGRHYVVYWNQNGFLLSSDFGAGLVPFCAIEFDWKSQQKEIRK